MTESGFSEDRAIDNTDAASERNEPAAGDAYQWETGSCHCGLVAFEVALTSHITITLCNCRICYMSGHEEILVPEDRFRVLHGSDSLREYRFGVKLADHTFCTTCGIMPFYRPRSHPVGFFSVNARCMLSGTAVEARRGDPISLKRGESIEYVQFDGQNWEKSMRANQHRRTE